MPKIRFLKKRKVLETWVLNDGTLKWTSDSDSSWSITPIGNQTDSGFDRLQNLSIKGTHVIFYLLVIC
jgi:hypothetical protein